MFLVGGARRTAAGRYLLVMCNALGPLGARSTEFAG
jgi:hypothetical protein